MRMALIASVICLLVIWGGLKLGYGIQPHLDPCFNPSTCQASQ